ncbi:hypothetical protein BDD12DRAFT_276992 [Trichophaea hybrida]|nr:hypothetical protein BDD12DRAFT_276992 [Trichophaea hybrida]
MAPRIIASQSPRIYARTIPRSGRQEGDPIRYPRIPPSSAYGEDNVLQHRDYSVSQFVGSPTSDTGRFDDPEYEDDATVDRPRSFPRTAYFPLTTGRQPSNRRVVQEEFEESEDSGDHSFVSAEEFFSAEEDSPLASRTPLNSYQRPSARSPPPRREANHSYPSRLRNGRGSRGGSHHRGSIPPPREAKAPRSRTLVDRTVYERRPISYVPQPVAPHSHHRAPPPPARTTSPIGQQATRTPVSRTKGKHRVSENMSHVRESFADVLQDERRNQQVGTGDVSGSALGFSTLPVTISKSKRGKESQKQPVEGRGFEKTQTPRIENPLQQSRNTRQSGTGQGFQPRYDDTEILQASQQSSRESSFQRSSSFEPPSTAPTSAQSSFNPAVPGPSQPECHITASGYYSDAPTEEDEEGWQRLEGISWLSRSREHPPATQPLQQSTGVVVEESNFEDDEEALMEHLREEAERERLRYAFDEQLPLEDQYDISEDFVREMAELDLDSGTLGPVNRNPGGPLANLNIYCSMRLLALAWLLACHSRNAKPRFLVSPKTAARLFTLRRQRKSCGMP